MALPRELTGHGLGEAPSRRIEEDDAGARRPQRLETARDGLGLHDHPAPAAERCVVRHTVPSLGPVAKIVDADVYQPSRAGAAHDGVAEGGLHHAGEQRDDVDSHRSSSPSGGSITIRRSLTFTSTTISGTAGTSSSRPSCATIHCACAASSCPPPAW